jgi:hypothetical protein
MNIVEMTFRNMNMEARNEKKEVGISILGGGSFFSIHNYVDKVA